MKLRIGTRGSDLALWQAHFVQGVLSAEAEVELVVLKTQGDQIDHIPLSKVEGKSFFTAEIERALIDGDVDVAVHSHKDLATEQPPGLGVAAVPARGPVGERLLVRPHAHDPEGTFLPLIAGARVGTSAPRRAEQLRALRPDLEVVDLRGNVPTRLRRLREERYDAVVLAAAGIDRLGLDLDGIIDVPLDPAFFVPAPAQGALAIQTRLADTKTTELCRRLLHDPATSAAIEAERRLLSMAGGGCSLPLGAHLRAAPGAGFEAHVFLGSGYPRPEMPFRWVRAEGATEDAAVQAAMTALEDDGPTETGPFRGKRIGLVGSARRQSQLGRRLEGLGAVVHYDSVIEFEDREARVAETFASLTRGDVVAVTSREAAGRLAGQQLPEGVTVAAVGTGTAAALEHAGFTVGYTGLGGAAELARGIEVGEGSRVVFPCAEEAREELPSILAERGVEVTRLVLYRTRPKDNPSCTGEVDARVYQSPSAVDALADLERQGPPFAGLRWALGASTAAALESHGLEARAPRGSGPDPLIAELARLWAPAMTPSH